MLLDEQYPLSVIFLATEGLRFSEQVIIGMESITLVFRSRSGGQFSESSISDKILKDSLSRFILTLKAS